MNDFFQDRKAKVDLFKKQYRKKKLEGQKVEIPEGLFVKCDACGEHIFYDDLEENLHVCPKCNFHFRLNPRQRLAITVDKNSFTEMYTNIASANPLDFPDYDEKISSYQSETGEIDAFVCGTGKINSIEVAIGVLSSFFMMGSMGSAVGEKITRLIEFASEKRLPLIIFSASGGARMQEGIISLMQMAKTSAAIKHHDNAGLLYISVLTNPTTGGVAASFASLGDIMIAEGGALIGFAGKRVIEQTIKEELPKDFQTAEFQLEKGFVDIVTNRNNLKNLLTNILKLHK
jgi:acetyl-CoA carboxylase carboxyl transferase subunit beta